MRIILALLRVATWPVRRIWRLFVPAPKHHTMGKHLHRRQSQRTRDYVSRTHSEGGARRVFWQ